MGNDLETLFDAIPGNKTVPAVGRVWQGCGTHKRDLKDKCFFANDRCP